MQRFPSLVVVYHGYDGKGQVFLEVLRLHRWIDLFDMLVKLDGHKVAYAYGYLANVTCSR